MQNTGAGIENPTHSQGRVEIPPLVHLIVACTLAVLTLIAVGLLSVHGAPRLLLVVILLAIAAVGVALELLYYMHLKVAPERRLFFIFFGSGLGLALLMSVSLGIIMNFVISAH